MWLCGSTDLPVLKIHNWLWVGKTGRAAQWLWAAASSRPWCILSGHSNSHLSYQLSEEGVPQSHKSCWAFRALRWSIFRHLEQNSPSKHSDWTSSLWLNIGMESWGCLCSHWLVHRSQAWCRKRLQQDSSSSVWKSCVPPADWHYLLFIPVFIKLMKLCYY